MSNDQLYTKTMPIALKELWLDKLKSYSRPYACYGRLATANNPSSLEAASLSLSDLQSIDLCPLGVLAKILMDTQLLVATDPHLPQPLFTNPVTANINDCDVTFTFQDVSFALVLPPNLADLVNLDKRTQMIICQIHDLASSRYHQGSIPLPNNLITYCNAFSQDTLDAIQQLV